MGGGGVSRRELLVGAATTLTMLPVAALAAERPDRRVAFRYRFPTRGSGIDTGGAIIDVLAPLPRVLAEVRKYGNYHKVLPRLEQSQVVGMRGGATDVYLRAPILRGVAHIWGVARFGAPTPWRGGQKIHATLVKGNLDGWFGTWKLRPCGPSRTVLRLEMFIDVKVPVPDAWVTPEIMWAADQGVTAIRDLVECGRVQHRDG